ncbi:hypothetical protein PTSG_12949 [Salpingoeca rosetta]|uniref:Uncharacterized protein n=1 Tax=Salpingoeca rosetta (strain ATCC 50818 / BSB-021) TaxID=946362 RepID=F2UNG6_SALR5|nr:uncharacterized protein PTSG_12949 [Salpingoeca rosetta]EGD79171.1 hypothetical protein PTSG_12949 [Salpingoeca rosetta]|eukprot:XP_004989256.1 hypothetical protein PTSG_12949 [Salpingoeca rosetta]
MAEGEDVLAHKVLPTETSAHDLHIPTAPQSTFTTMHMDAPPLDSAMEEIPDIATSISQPEVHGVSTLHLACAEGLAEEVYNMLAQYTPETIGAVLDLPDGYGRFPLTYAVAAPAEQAVSIITMLQSCGADVMAVDVTGRAAAHWACMLGAATCLEQLLSLGMDANMVDNAQRNLAHLAAIAETPDCLHVLAHVFGPDSSLFLAHDASAVDTEGRTAYHCMASNCTDPTCLQVFLDVCPKTMNVADSQGRTPLHVAVAQDNTAMVAAFVNTRVCIKDLPDSDGMTPLFWAVSLARPECVTLLLQAGPQATCATKKEATVFHYASILDSTATLDALLNYTQFTDTVSPSTPAMIERLLNAGCNPNSTDSNGATALHLAAYGSHHDAMAVLIQHKVDLNAQDGGDQLTPLIACCQNDDAAGAMLLLEAGCDPSLSDAGGRTALHHAASASDAATVLTILPYAANPAPLDATHATPLHFACFGGCLASVNALLSAGADANVVDADGVSPLHWAALEGHADVVAAMLQHNAWPNYMEHSDKRFTPLDYAHEREHERVVEMLRDAGGYTRAEMAMIAVLKIQRSFRAWKKSTAAISAARAELEQRQREKKEEMRKEEEERKKREEEEEEMRKEEEERKKREEEEEEEERKKQEKRNKEAEEQERKKREEEERKIQAEEEARKKLEEEQARMKKEEEEMRKKEEEDEAMKKEAEQQKESNRLEEERAKREEEEEEERKKQAEEEEDRKKKQAEDEEKERKKQAEEEEERRKQAEVEEDRKKKEEERKKREEEEERKKQEEEEAKRRQEEAKARQKNKKEEEERRTAAALAAEQHDRAQAKAPQRDKTTSPTAAAAAAVTRTRPSAVDAGDALPLEETATLGLDARARALILHRSMTRRSLQRRETARVSRIRAAVVAAITIQRAWRRHRAHTREQQERVQRLGRAQRGETRPLRQMASSSTSPSSSHPRTRNGGGSERAALSRTLWSKDGVDDAGAHVTALGRPRRRGGGSDGFDSSDSDEHMRSPEHRQRQQQQRQRRQQQRVRGKPSTMRPRSANRRNGDGGSRNGGPGRTSTPAAATVAMSGEEVVVDGVRDKFKQRRISKTTQPASSRRRSAPPATIANPPSSRTRSNGTSAWATTTTTTTRRRSELTRPLSAAMASYQSAVQELHHRATQRDFHRRRDVRGATTSAPLSGTYRRQSTNATAITTTTTSSMRGRASLQPRPSARISHWDLDSTLSSGLPGDGSLLASSSSPPAMSYRRARRIRNAPGVRPYDLWGLQMPGGEHTLATTDSNSNSNSNSDTDSARDGGDRWQLVHTSADMGSAHAPPPSSASSSRDVSFRGTGLQRTRRHRHNTSATQLDARAPRSTRAHTRRTSAASGCGGGGMYLAQMQEHHNTMVRQRQQKLLSKPGHALAASLPKGSSSQR